MVFPEEFADFTDYFHKLGLYLQKYSWIYETPVTHLLTCDVFSKIPADWVEPLLDLTIEEFNNVSTGLIKDNWPTSLKEFLADCKRFTLPVLACDTPPYTLCNTDDWIQSVPREMWRGMSRKKREEVEIMSAFVHHENQFLGIDKIVDLGSGLGYIDRILLLQGYKILGIESQAKLVTFATIQKENFFPSTVAQNLNYVNMNISVSLIPEVRNAIVKDLINVTIKGKPATGCKHKENVNKYDWERLISSPKDVPADKDCKKVCMIGLHACGDLAVTGLKMYLSLPEVSVLVLVPCCYHKMSFSECQNIAEDSLGSNSEEKFNNFPLSMALMQVCADVGRSFVCRPFLRLASQATNSGWQGWTEADHQQHSFNVMSRAVIELFIQQENATFKKCFRRLVRKTSLKDQDFSNYVDESLSRCEFTNQKQLVDFEQNRDKIRCGLLNMWEQHLSKLRLAEVITGLQMCLEPVAESLIVADRVCFLREKGLENVRVIRMIDNKLSPRCLAYVASKV